MVERFAGRGQVGSRIISNPFSAMAEPKTIASGILQKCVARKDSESCTQLAKAYPLH